MSQKHEISCWKCHEMTSLETRNEFDGCCWACGEEIDLDDYLIKAMDKRDEHYVALSAVTAERDQLRAEVEALRKDAERFRHIERDCDSGMSKIYGDNWIAVIDEHIAVDAAMAAKEG